MTILQTLDKAANAEDRYAAGAFCKLARLLTAARGDPMQALALAQAHRAKERIVGILKSAVTSGSFDGLECDFRLRQHISQAFSESLRSLSAFGAMLADGMVPAPLCSRCITVTTGITGSSPKSSSTLCAARTRA